MADADVAQVFQNLAVEMSNVSTALGPKELIKLLRYMRGTPRNLRNGLSLLKNIQF